MFKLQETGKVPRLFAGVPFAFMSSFDICGKGTYLSNILESNQNNDECSFLGLEGEQFRIDRAIQYK